MMSAAKINLSQVFEVPAEQRDGLHYYALLDLARCPEFPGFLTDEGACLFGSGPGTPIARVSPHLVRLPRRVAATAWRGLVEHRGGTSWLSVMASRLSFKEVLRHLRAHLQVKIGKNTMYLAYWDPAILAVLVGQPDDDTLFVRGPVLDPAQLGSFLSPMSCWWYWDRRNALRGIDCARPGTSTPAEALLPVLPLEFRAEQTDLLVQASLPDRVLHELRVSQPHLLEERDESQNYELACRLLKSAQSLRLRGLRDQVNFVGAGMILGEAFHLHPDVRPWLEDVPTGSRRFIEALRRVPAEALEAARKQELQRL